MWGSTVFEVVRQPEPGGVVYSVAPVGDRTWVRQVHRTMLKLALPLSPMPNPVRLLRSPEAARNSQSDEEKEGTVDDGLWMVLTEPACDQAAPAPPTPTLTAPVAQQPAPVAATSAPRTPLQEGPSTSTAVPLKSTPKTAGQHSNMHRLPRSA